MHVSSVAMVPIGAFMLYRLLRQRKRLRSGVFLFWLIFFGVATLVATFDTATSIFSKL